MIALHSALPDDMRQPRDLPGIQPVTGAWLTVDEAYAAQMTRREALLRTDAPAVLYLEDGARAAALELLDLTLRESGFARDGDAVIRPDGVRIVPDPAHPMATLGRLFQQDFCLLQKRGGEHVLTGAVLCFPASWRLDEKAGRPLTTIHDPVDEYDAGIARRVQRLFDGVQAGRPIWRFNQLWYEDPELFQPRSAQEPRRVGRRSDDGPYLRSERQTILRLPDSGAVVFVIHTYVLTRDDARAALDQLRA